MLERGGAQWCDCLGLQPDQPAPPPAARSESSGLAAAITATVEAIIAADAPPTAPAGLDRSAERPAKGRHVVAVAA
jgi:hypothetical protein